LFAETAAMLNEGYIRAFSWAAGFILITAIVVMLLRVPKEKVAAE
jgi:Ni,Fe-hydrogenase I cytochrome b subunit